MTITVDICDDDIEIMKIKTETEQVRTEKVLVQIIITSLVYMNEIKS
jgi:hypothetical protein